MTRLIMLITAIWMAALLASGSSASAFAAGQINGAPSPSIPLFGGNTFGFTGSVPSVSQITAANTAIGATAVRLGMMWADVEIQPGVYAVPGDAAAKIAAALAAGQKIVLCFNGGHPAYTGSWATFPTTRAADTGFANALAWVAQQYQGRGIVWEPLNEPNNNGLTPMNYADLLSAVIPAVLAKVPDAKIITAGIGGTNGQYGDPNAFMATVKAAVDAKLWSKLAGVGLHPYPGQLSIDPIALEQPEAIAHQLAAMRAAIGAGTPIYITECGYTSSWIGGNETTRAIHLARLYLAALADGNVPLVTFYTLFDTGQDSSNGGVGPVNDQFHFGIYGFDHATPKPAVAALGNLMAALSGASAYDAAQVSKNVWAVTLVQANGARTIVAWTGTGQAVDYRVKLMPSGPVVDIFGNRQWIALNAGGITEVTLPATGMPLILGGT